MNPNFTPRNYPLQWPAGWPRTEQIRRETGRFDTDLNKALNNLRKQIGLMGGSNLVLSSNCSLGHENPADCGVVAYFVWQKKNLAVPCDRWLKVSHNVQAIALTIEAMRGMERWGAKHMIEAMFTGFKALPESADAGTWWEIMGLGNTCSWEQVKEAYRRLAMAKHPDRGGNHDEMTKLNQAYRRAEEHFKVNDP